MRIDADIVYTTETEIETGFENAAESPVARKPVYGAVGSVV